MSETTTERPAPRRVNGLDAMTDEDNRLLREMQQADAAPEPEASDPPPAQDAEEAPASEESPPTDAKPRRDTKVPHAALHEERVKRQKAEATAREQEAKHAAELARAEERLQLLAAAVTEATKPAPQAAPAPEPIPDFDADPAGHIRATFKAQQREMEALRAAFSQQGQTLQQQQQQAAQQQALADLSRWAQQQEAAMATADPTYLPAQKHLLEMRHAELEAMGYGDFGQRQQMIANDALQLANQTRQQGGNFAERVLALAKARGFAPAAPAAPAAPSLTDAAVELPRAAINAERGRDMALSLGTAGGAPRGPLTVDAILRMPTADFEKMLANAKKNPAAMRQLFGD